MQFVEIAKVLGSPSVEDLRAMNHNYLEYKFTPKMGPQPWAKVFRGWSPREANELVDALLRYDPTKRLPPLHALLHRFFDDLRRDKPAHRMLFNFKPDELRWCTARERERLIPKWAGAM